MSKLIGSQPGTLLALVQYANKNAGILPTAKELANVINLNERAASGRIKRLVDSNPTDFKGTGRNREINYEYLCTEPETAQLLVMIRDSVDDKGRISELRLRELKNGMELLNDVNIIDKLINAGYIERLLIDNDYFRLTSKFIHQFEYIKLLSRLT